jgi:hypothetical protein
MKVTNMPDMTLHFSVRLALGLTLLLLTGCNTQPKIEPRNLQIEQTWELQPGDVIAGHRVNGGLGDISIELKGTVHAPFEGELEPHQNECVIFSSPQIPAYVLRLCGVRHPKLGEVREGEAIGSADVLVFAALRRQRNGKWAMVEPSSSIIERTVR